MLASTSEDGSIRFWDISAAMEKFRLEQLVTKHEETTNLSCVVLNASLPHLWNRIALIDF